MKNKNILISGAGVAGLTLAFWLKRFGFNPTMVERHPSLRTGGYKIDLRGVALDVLKRMGIYSEIVDSRTAIKYAICVDENGNEVTRMTPDLLGTRLENVDLEIMRGTLCVIMQKAIGDKECLFGDSIAQIVENSDGVHVIFEKNEPRTFDLVIGADGLHSRVRQLVFGDETKFIKNFGVYVSVFSFPNFLNLTDCEIEHHSHLKFVNLYRDRKDVNAKAAIAFSVAKPFRFNSREAKEQQNLIKEAFAELKWEMPRILACMEDSPDFFFDVMAQIHMHHWSKGRITLAGDAAYSASPMSGQGTSIAIAGAYVLAGELMEAQGDYQKAFAKYEEQVRPFVKKNQDLSNMSARIMSDSAYSAWLYRLGALLPARLILFFKNRALRKTTKAANAIILKDYK